VNRVGSMAERRTLTEGLKPRTEAERKAEAEFVYQAPTKGAPASEAPAAASRPHVARMPLTTRIRADIAQALKRASLERQLQSVEPNSVQDILEAALEPWLREHGYLG
jgi:hypothetical protein